MNLHFNAVLAVISLCFCASSLRADVQVPHMFTDHMVLQRNRENPVWGKADAGEKVTVSIDGQQHKTVADVHGDWRIKLDPMQAGGGALCLTIKGKNSLQFNDVLIGEVWICSGQSNMQFAMDTVNDRDVEIAAANYPEIRLLSIPLVGSQQPLTDFMAQWKPCTPESVRWFSAIGYLYGRKLHHALGVPIGLINNAWGGSDLEAWLPRRVLSADYPHLLAHWDQLVEAYGDEVHAAKMVEYDAWVAEGKLGDFRYEPYDIRTGQKRPANIFNGVLNPTIGYGIKGVIWYQGESNLSRALEYRTLFPLLINTWRKVWGQGDFPFYWVQLADCNAEVPEPGKSDWAVLREAQTMTLALPNTGETVSFDLGEGRDIHFRDKQTVANRLVRHALAKEYGFDMASDSPRYASMATDGPIVTLTFDHIDQGLYAFDTREVFGFSIAGPDGKFVWATAHIAGKNQVRVSSDQVAAPAAVRYGWANNPVINLYDRNGLPVTPFRTDDWPVK